MILLSSRAILINLSYDSSFMPHKIKSSCVREEENGNDMRLILKKRVILIYIFHLIFAPFSDPVTGIFKIGMIDATIWDDDAISFNKEAVATLHSPVIVAITSMKVTLFQATPTDFAATRRWFSIGGAKTPSRDIGVGLDDYKAFIQCRRKLQKMEKHLCLVRKFFNACFLKMKNDECIFKINPGNNQEEHLRMQLNNGVIPDRIDVHCLARLIKAWFRELPTGFLDPLARKVAIQCQSEEDCTTLCHQLDG
ncbi:rho GTPase activating protein with PAK-box/P21-Rho-binding domain-containing protein [Artemisia annua]|uniref:Rho GTPase activating protein with PAK-box/P21-Rho-binding domain-containing protein n=1 Tax=Artemisia annua TaxID=35608 RepID=A0A2U1Q108_ARTAN|nr:rho GTPase activating protein with PAK-box/P21-Rho-binding domain-containing protein [Artemisia annua]